MPYLATSNDIPCGGNSNFVQNTGFNFINKDHIRIFLLTKIFSDSSIDFSFVSKILTAKGAKIDFKTDSRQYLKLNFRIKTKMIDSINVSISISPLAETNAMKLLRILVFHLNYSISTTASTTSCMTCQGPNHQFGTFRSTFTETTTHFATWIVILMGRKRQKKLVLNFLSIQNHVHSKQPVWFSHHDVKQRSNFERFSNEQKCLTSHSW